MREFFLSVILIVFIFSCTEQPKSKDYEKCGENLKFGIISSTENIKKDLVETKLDTMILVDEQFVENKIKIEKKFGEQWDFCRCVLANDSLDRLIKNNAELDDDFMKAFDKVDQKCRAFLVMSPNTTPEERAEHENKIKKCLRLPKR